MNKWEERRYMLKAGILCGLALFFASNIQQMGMVYTSASKAGFISSLYIIIVPMISIFLGRKFPHAMAWHYFRAFWAVFSLCCGWFFKYRLR